MNRILDTYNPHLIDSGPGSGGCLGSEASPSEKSRWWTPCPYISRAQKPSKERGSNTWTRNRS